MPSKISTRFVNQARNQVFLAGLYAKIDGRHHIVQSRNLANAIPVEIKPELLPLIDRQPYQFAAHVRGYVNEDTRKPNASIDVFYVHRPALGSISKNMTAMAMLGRKGIGAIEDESALPSYSDLKARMVEQFAISGAEAEYILGADKDTTTCLNRVYVTGFVGNKAFVSPSLEHDTEGYVTFQLLQFPDLERAIPVRVMRANQAFGKVIRKGQPINLVASVAVDRRVDAEGNVTTQVYLRTDRDSVSMALASDFEDKTFPAWWRTLLQEHMAAKGNGGASPEAPAPMRAPRPVREQPIALAAASATAAVAAATAQHADDDDDANEPILEDL